MENTNLPLLKFGSTLDTCKYENIKNLLKLTYSRAIIDLEGMDGARVFARSEYHKLLTIKDLN